MSDKSETIIATLITIIAMGAMLWVFTQAPDISPDGKSTQELLRMTR